MRFAEQLGVVIAYVGGIFLIAALPIMSVLAVVTADMQPGAWGRSVEGFGLIVMFAIIALAGTFALQMPEKED